jgi:ankyrin repeat protein
MGRKDVLVRLLYSFMLLNRYRWAHCQLERLRLCVASELKHTLDELPDTLEGTYTRILREIPDENRDRAHRLFQCLTVSARPLRVEELAMVLAIDFTAEGNPTLNVGVRGGNQEKAIRLACSSLVTFITHRDGSRIVQFSHFSVKEFLTSENLFALQGVANYRILLESAHTIMAQACLAVLLRLDYRTDRKSIKKYPLADYSVTHFVSHAEFGNVIPQIGDGIDTLLDAEKPHFAAWLWARRMSHSWRWTRHPERLDALPLYYVAELGFLGIVQHLISKRPQDASARGGFYGTPLHAAVNMGHIEVSRLLLEKCQDADIRGALDMTPLHLACRNGDSNLVQMLLDLNDQRNKNANPLRRVARSLPFKLSRAKSNNGVFARNSLKQTPLHLGCEGGHHLIIPLLVDRGADVDAQGEHDRTPLHLALASLLYDRTKLKAVYTLLLKSGANVNKPDDTGRTPLHLTANLGFFCDTELVDLLVKYGANLRKQDKEGNTVLHLVSSLEHLTLSNRYVQVVRLLLQSGADARARNEKGSTALHLASRRGCVDIVQLLLDQAVEVDVQNNYRSTPLHLALYHRHVTVAKLLIHRGANVHARDRTGNTPLHLASDRGKLKGIVLLLDKGADVNVQNDIKLTPLHFASSHHHNAAAMLLIQYGANVHARTGNGKTALHLASNLGNCKIMRLFLDKGANVDAQDNTNSTPLHLASSHFDEKPANLLIKHGANLHARDSNGKTALHLASDRGNINIMQLLLDKGAKVDARDNTNSTPLHLASSHYHEDPAKLLIDRGANIGTRNKAGETPFQIASKTNHGPGRVESLLFEYMCSSRQNR